MRRFFGSVLVLGVISTVASAQEIHQAELKLERREWEEGAVYYAPELILEENETIVFDEPAKVFTNKLTLPKNAVIDSTGNDLQIFVKESVDAREGFVDVSAEKSFDTCGVNGDNGKDGEKAMDALKGGAGASGSNGSEGSDGVDGADVSIITPVLNGNLYVITRGGDGGQGGHGGAGGKGGAGFGGSDARTLYYFRGIENIPIPSLIELGTAIGVPVVGQVLAIMSIFNGIRIGDGFDGFDGGAGGSGGDGALGGNGGRGGELSLVFGRQENGTKIWVNTKGGKGGAGGRGGAAAVGGVGGDGGKRGDIWAREGFPGKSGAPGRVGRDGRSGRSGVSGRVSVRETGDVEWVKCYVRYREILDWSQDSELAREVLNQCSARR